MRLSHDSHIRLLTYDINDATVRAMKTARSENEVMRVREKILEGALDIIVNEGFDALTMRHLASGIGMTAPNIYNYFSNKDELYITIVIRGFEMLQSELKNAYKDARDDVARVKAMIDAYLRFGIERPRYYDIMFTRPTPKYNDYIGTPFEKLSETEFNISMEIAKLAMKAAGSVLKMDPGDEAVQLRVIHIWSLLHGMISLYNSHIISYVAEKAEEVYSKLISEFMDDLTEK